MIRLPTVIVITIIAASGCQALLNFPTGQTTTYIESDGEEFVHTRLNFNDSRQEPSSVLVSLHRSVSPAGHAVYLVEVAILDTESNRILPGRSLELVVAGRPIILSTRIGNEESHVNIRGYMLERASYPITRTELRQLAEAGEITMTIRTHEGTIRRVFDESHKTALQEFYRRFVQNHSKK